MTSMFIEKINLKDLEEALANSTTVHAVVGAGDFAVEKAMVLRDELASRAAAIDPKALRDVDAKALRDQAQSRIVEGAETLQAGVAATPEQLKALPERAQEWPAKAQSLFADVIALAFAVYGDLAGRGQTRVAQLRRTDESAFEADDVVIEPVTRPVAKKPEDTDDAG